MMGAVTYFKALADETRVRLVNILSRYELNVNEIVEIMQMGQSRVSRHLKILSDSGILRARRDGLWIFYTLAGDGPGGDFFRAIEYLLDSEPVLSADLEQTGRTIERRSLRTTQFFDSIASDWGQLRDEILGDFDISGEIVNRIPAGGLTADLGCGSGDLLLRIAGIGGPIIGVDRSRKMLEEAGKPFGTSGHSIDLRIGELEHLPLRDREVDTAVLNMVLHHLHAPVVSIQEVYRILKPGGTLIIAEFLAHTREEMRRTHLDRWLGFTSDEVERWLRDSSLELVETKSYQLKQGLEICLYMSKKQSEPNNFLKQGGNA